jgi:DNA replication and repair protein RecF
MRIDGLYLKNYRNIKHLKIDSFSPGINLFTGRNGSGKTNILEAIGLSSIAKSCRGATDSEIVNFDSESALVELNGLSEKKKSQ